MHEATANGAVGDSYVFAINKFDKKLLNGTVEGDLKDYGTDAPIGPPQVHHEFNPARPLVEPAQQKGTDVETTLTT